MMAVTPSEKSPKRILSKFIKTDFIVFKKPDPEPPLRPKRPCNLNQKKKKNI